MLFNSYGFIFAFLPIVLIGFLFLGNQSQVLACSWLIAASLFFYGWWNPDFVILLILSIIGNYLINFGITNHPGSQKAKTILIIGVTANLSLLAFYKYTNFFIDIANSAYPGIPHLNVILPLGISFFTFTQIAFLVDTYRGLVRERDLLSYFLFVTWFPHLIAGPVLHHKQMMPQFRHKDTYRVDADALVVGTSYFVVGLAKKVLLADEIADYANPVFASAEHGTPPMLFAAWTGALAYALQLYFDFSGYSDMAIGISKMFNIKLPVNFNSPYKAKNAIEFWKRWHITLSHFLRDYLYIPMGGNRKGPTRRFANLLATMLLGGLWHGAGWNFILWGGIHGLYLVINHGWRSSRLKSTFESRVGRILATGVTFVAILVAWVPFRAETLKGTGAVWSGMMGLNGVSLPVRLEPWLANHAPNGVTFLGLFPDVGINPSAAEFWLGLGLFIVWALPNTQQWFSRFQVTWDKIAYTGPWVWRSDWINGALIGLLATVSVMSFKRVSQFLYFQF